MGSRRFATDWVRRITGTTRYDPDRTAQLASSLDPMARGLAGDLALSGARFWVHDSYIEMLMLCWVRNYPNVKV